MTRTQAERKGVDAIRSEVHKHGNLLDHFNDGDKGISWDGFIEVFGQDVVGDPQKDQYINDIKVQIKGTRVSSFDEKILKKPVKVADIRNYQRETKGTLYFIVQVKLNGEYKIFYYSFLPFEIKKALKGAGTQKSITILFSALNTDKLSFYDLCISFLKDMETQVGKEIVIFVSSQDVIEFGMPLSLSLVANFTQDPKDALPRFAPLHVPEHNKQRIYFMKGNMLAVREIDELSISPEISLQIFVEGKKFYDDAHIAWTSNGNEIILGNKIIFGSSLNITFEFDGSIEDAIRDVEFLLLARNKDIKVFSDNKQVAFMSGIRFDQVTTDLLLDRQAWLKNTSSVLKKFNVSLEINLKALSDYEQALIYWLNDENRQTDNDAFFQMAELAQKNILFCLYKDQEGTIKICNPYTDEITFHDFQYSLNNGDKRVSGSIFMFLLQDLRVLDCWNFNPSLILQDIKRYDINEDFSNLLTTIGLSLLHYFDINSIRTDVLKLAEGIFAILKSYATGETSHIINFAQSVLRHRNLNEEENEQVYHLSSGNMVACCKAILLDNKYDFEVSYKKLTEDEIKDFLNWPIVALCKWL